MPRWNSKNKGPRGNNPQVFLCGWSMNCRGARGQQGPAGPGPARQRLSQVTAGQPSGALSSTWSSAPCSFPHVVSRAPCDPTHFSAFFAGSCFPPLWLLSPWALVHSLQMISQPGSWLKNLPTAAPQVCVQDCLLDTFTWIAFPQAPQI